jgi:hypothetical protein
MEIIRGNYPMVGFFIPDGDTTQNRIAFKYRIVSEPLQSYSSTPNGLIDVGTGATIITSTKFQYTSKSKVIMNDILYSVNSITPVITDAMAQGLVKKKLMSEYIISLV